MAVYYVYIMASKTGTLYVGSTGDLEHRVKQHKKKEVEGFAKKYDVDRLIYFEEVGDKSAAIRRERQIKAWRREKKVDLVGTMNPGWCDLSEGGTETRKIM